MEETRYAWGQTIQAVLGNTDLLSKLARYEVGLSNQLDKAMEQLKKRQVERLEQNAETLKLIDATEASK